MHSLELIEHDIIACIAAYNLQHILIYSTVSYYNRYINRIMKVCSLQNSLSNGLNMYLKKPFGETQLTVTLLIGFVILLLQRTLELDFDILHKIFFSGMLHCDHTMHLFCIC